MQERKSKTIKRILTVIILIAGFAAALWWLLIRVPPESIRVSLLYKSASMGKFPDGTRLDPYSILSDEILEKVESNCNVPVEELKEAMSVTYLGSEGNSTTDIVVTCDLKNKELNEKVLEATGNLYAEYIATEFCENTDVIYKPLDVSNLDYLEAADMMDLECSRLATYLRARVMDDTDSGRKESYISLRGEVENLSGIRIKGFREVAKKNGLSLSPITLQSVLVYRQGVLERTLNANTRQKDTRNKALQIYDATLFPTTSVPSVKDGEYYISTTRTGLDDIFADTKFFIDTGLDFENELSDVKYTLKHLRFHTKSEALQEEKSEIAEEIARIKAECISLLDAKEAEDIGDVRWEFSKE